jgi:hypothetical protein
MLAAEDAELRKDEEKPDFKEGVRSFRLTRNKADFAGISVLVDATSTAQ